MAASPRARFIRTSLLGAFFILAIIVLTVLSSGQKYAEVTGFSAGPLGLSAFVKVSRELKGKSVVLQKKALFSPADLDDFGIFLVLAPRVPFSAREAGLLRKYVEQGGIAVLSFHDDTSMGHIAGLAKELGIHIEFEEDPSFINGATRSLTSTEEIFPFAADRQYAMYSHMRLTGCAKPGHLECFVKAFAVGKGKVVVVAGVVPLVNALLGRESNPHVALQLINSNLPIGVDEYHHFFTEKSVVDLFLEPTFALPIFGVTIAALLFMIWGRLNLEDAYGEKRVENIALPYHSLNQRILRGLTSKKYSDEDLTRAHMEYLLRLFPTRLEEIKDIQSGSGKPLERAHALLELHKRFAKDNA